MRQHIIALIDCDSFYVSCERKDNPSLQNRPVCVMTGGGNKGIIVSRSKEVKALGIKMGVPYFQIMNTHKQIICIPARMHRYSEISYEVMKIIKNFSPDVEVTSVDEAYIDLTGLNKVYNSSYTDIIKKIRQTIWDKTGIPVSIGLGCSKTLAKLASDKAKYNNGIFVIHPDKIIDIIGETPIEDVCGIGLKNSEKMKFNGIFTIRDFVERDNAWIRKAFGIVGLNLKSELIGIATSLVNKDDIIPQSIQDTGSFEDFSQNLDYLKHKLSEHTHAACQKLRRKNGFCSEIEVMLKTKDFKYYVTETKFENPTNSDREVKSAAIKLLISMFNQNIIYRATGITLKNLTYGKQIQQSLFDTLTPHDDKLSRVVDELEAKYGQGIVKSGI